MSAILDLRLGDCMDGMKEFPDNYFDLAIVDPEYGINAGKKKQYHKGAFTTYKAKDWDVSRPNLIYFRCLQRVSKNQIIWGANYFSDLLPPAKNWIVWDKLQPEGVSFSMHELAFYSGAGQAKIYRGYNGANRCTNKDLAREYTRIHPTQKPVDLYKWLLKNYAKPENKILDTHLGSMSSAIACWDMGFDLTGWEIDEDYYKAGIERVENHKKQISAFDPRPEASQVIQLKIT